MYKIKFPGGRCGHELLHYMGMTDPKGHLLERPEVIQKMADRCAQGKVAEYTREEVEQLIKECTHALDMKSDKVGDDEWSYLDQYRLGSFKLKLLRLLS